jgi:lysophospholipase L1-like esterase
MQLPPLRRKRRSINLSKVAGYLSSGVATINSTVEPRAVFWDEWNEMNLSGDSPLWVALGDSVTQGIGSSKPETSYVRIVLDRLKTRTGHDWRLINLSMSGGRFLDIVNKQVPIINDYELKPTLTTAIIGSNDLMWRRDTKEILNDAKSAIDSLPHGSFLSKISTAQRGKRAIVSSVINDLAPSKGIHLFNAWNWPTGEGMWAEDRFHPNDEAYKYIANNLWDSIVSHLTL